MTNPRLPNPTQPIVGTGGVGTRQWLDYFRTLDQSSTVEDLRRLISEANAAIEALENEGGLPSSTRVFGDLSVNSEGTLSQGVVVLTLVNDQATPGPTTAYGANPEGLKGFYPISDAIESVEDETTKEVSESGVTSIGLADVPDAGGGELQKTEFDGKGRKIGTSNATTDDLEEGANNLYFTDERAQDATGAVLDDTGDVELNYSTSPARRIWATLSSAVQSAISAAVTALQPGDNITDLTNNAGYIPDAPANGTTYGRNNNTWVGVAAGTGTVTSVGLSVPTGLAVSGSPVTTSGTLALSWSSGYQGYTTTEATKLAGIAAGAQVNVATNLAQGTRTTTAVPVTSSTGTSATLDAATTSLAGVMSSADKVKLNALPSGNQSANQVYAGPASGAAAPPSFRALVASDTPGQLPGWSAIVPADKANDNAVVHTTGDETAAGAKTWTGINSWVSASGFIDIGRTPGGTAGIIGTYSGTHRGDIRFDSGRIRIGASTSTSQPSIFLDLYASGVLEWNGSTVWTAATFNPATKADVSGQVFTGNVSVLTTNARVLVGLTTPNGGLRNLGADGTGLFGLSSEVAGGEISFRPNINSAGEWRVTSAALRPSTDNSVSLGLAGNRASVIYAATGAINTSDAREKYDVRALSENEINAAVALSKEVKFYQWKDSVAKKGADKARWHSGMVVQRAIQVMQSFGLDPFRYAFICYDQWPEEPQVVGPGGEVMQPYRAAGDRYSFRLDQLNEFISAGLSQRVSQLETRFAKTLSTTTTANGVSSSTFVLPDDNMALSITPRTGDAVVSGITQTGRNVTVGFRRLRNSGISLLGLVNLNLFETSPGVVTFDVVATPQS